MKTIAFDVMGNDYGVEPAISAALKFCEQHLDYQIILVGQRQEISKYVRERAKIRILHVDQFVDTSATSFEARNPNTSMAVAITLVKDQKADAVVSAGASKVFIALTTIILGRLPNVTKPAFMPIFPTIIKSQTFLMLDVGANLNVNSDNLVQWAQIANVFSREVLHIIKPRVAIVNIGTESNKGFPFHVEAHQKLKAMKEINYIGFIEPKELLNAKVDVAVVDGYGGNLILKAMEGSLMGVLTVIKTQLNKTLITRLAAGVLKKTFYEVKDSLDYRNFGAAWVIGLKGLAIKAHGASDTRSYLAALRLIYDGLEANALQKIQDAM